MSRFNMTIVAAVSVVAACGEVNQLSPDARAGGTTASDADPGAPDAESGADTAPTHGAMSFFVTSTGMGSQGGDLGGLSGADDRCGGLAVDVGAGGRTWRAYLSTTAENARERIGTGPWYNANGELVATDVDQLHRDGIGGSLVLTEKATLVPGNEHDVLTGSDPDGWLDAPIANCLDWSSNNPNDWAVVGHADWDPGDSWNSTHLSQCDPAGLAATAGSGRTYCFAID